MYGPLLQKMIGDDSPPRQAELRAYIKEFVFVIQDHTLVLLSQVQHGFVASDLEIGSFISMSGGHIVWTIIRFVYCVSKYLDIYNYFIVGCTASISSRSLQCQT